MFDLKLDTRLERARPGARCALCGGRFLRGTLAVVLFSVHRWGVLDHARSHRVGECVAALSSRAAA